MKKCCALLMCLMMMLGCLYAAAETVPERTPACYAYALADEGSEYVENLIFNEPVIVSGENAQIIFFNCEFNADLILTAEEGTRVLLLGCDVNGQCILQNNQHESTIAYSFPKFLSDTPISVVCEDCIGTAVAMGDVEIIFNGQSYTMADSKFFNNSPDPEANMVAYEGQEASYYCIAQWWENGEKNLLILAEAE